MSKKYFVSRHAGAHDWAVSQGFQGVDVVEHFDVDVVREADVVLGTLPVHLAYQVCHKGGRYFHLRLDLPVELRGQEISADQMEELGASLSEFIVTVG